MKIAMTVFEFLKLMKKEYPDRWYSAKEISEKLDISMSSTVHTLRKPRECGLIKHKEVQKFDCNGRLQNCNVYQY